MSPNRVRHRELYAGKIPDRPPDSKLQIGSRNSRKGWNRSIDAELGNRNARETNEWREKVLTRDGYRCVKCGDAKQLEADHIKPWSLYPDLRFNLDNGQTLCHKHHVETATYGTKIHKLVAVNVEKL